MTNPSANEARDRTEGLSAFLTLLTPSSLHLIVRFGLTDVTTALAVCVLIPATNFFVFLSATNFFAFRGWVFTMREQRDSNIAAGER